MTAAVSGAPLWLALVMVALGGVGAVLDARRHERRNGKERTMSEPDEAAVEAVADAIAAHFFPRWGWSEMRESFQVGYRKLASAVLATPVVAEAFRDAERLRNLAAMFDGHPNRDQQTYRGAEIAAMLRGDGA